MKHSAERTFRLLEALNRRPFAFVRELAVETGISKPSVVRLLGIMIEMGYVQRLGSAGAYALANGVLRLSSGFHPETPLVSIARPMMEQLTAELDWPSALGVLEQFHVSIRASTIPSSPLAWYHSTLFSNISARNSALGRAILAFLPEHTRLTVIDNADEVEAFNDDDLPRSLLIEKLASISEAGFALRLPSAGHPTMSLACPVIVAARPLAAISMTIYARAMAPQEAIKRYVPRLRETAEATAAEVEAIVARDEVAVGQSRVPSFETASRANSVAEPDRLCP